MDDTTNTNDETTTNPTSAFPREGREWEGDVGDATDEPTERVMTTEDGVFAENYASFPATLQRTSRPRSFYAAIILAIALLITSLSYRSTASHNATTIRNLRHELATTKAKLTVEKAHSILQSLALSDCSIALGIAGEVFDLTSQAIGATDESTLSQIFTFSRLTDQLTAKIEPYKTARDSCTDSGLGSGI